MWKQLPAIASSTLSSSLAGWRGTMAFAPAARQPHTPLRLYEFEACPHCRRVREALTALELDADIRPCPRGGTRFRAEAQQLAGRAQFPLLVDGDADMVLLESTAIIRHLYERYAGRAAPASLLLAPLDRARSLAASLPRPRRGLRARPSRAPAEALELYSFESSPFSRLVRERLCELELPYRLRNAGKAQWQDMGPPQLRAALFADTPVRGRNRRALLARAGRVQFPYLIDPNTGVALFESARILDYLEREYAR